MNQNERKIQNLENKEWVILVFLYMIAIDLELIPDIVLIIIASLGVFVLFLTKREIFKLEG